MHALDPSQLNRLLRDLELTAPVAIRRAVPHAEQYLWLVTRLHGTDARTDVAFQQRLARHIGLRGKLRARKTALFELLEALKAIPEPGFADVLSQVSALTGQVEKSVASALLGLLDPDRPAIDRDVRELLPRYGFPTLAEAPPFDECVAWHARLERLFDQVIASARWPSISTRHEAGLPAMSGVVLSEVRKLNLHLSHARKVVALMPTLEPVVRRVRPPVLAASEVQAPRASVRLHLCR